MTVDANSTFEFNISQVILMAYQAAGLMNETQSMSGIQWSQKASMAMNFLELDLKALQAEGIFVRPMDFYDLNVVAGTRVYELPASTLDVIGTAMWSSTGSSVQTSVFPIQREVYQRYSNKDTQGQPSMYYPDRQAVLNVYLYPAPIGDGVLTFQRHRLLANVRSGQNTLDVERHWVKYLVYELAKHMAFCHSLGVQTAKALGGEAEAAKKIAKAYSKQRGPQMFYVGHRTGWRQ